MKNFGMELGLRMAKTGKFSKVVVIGKDFAKPAKPRAIQPLSESALQIAVVEHLRLTGVPGLLFFSIPNEGKRSAANGARLKAMGMLPGVADLFVKRPDRYPLFIELKAKGKEPRPEQWAFHKAAYQADCGWAWADNIDDALKILREYGAIRSK